MEEKATAPAEKISNKDGKTSDKFVAEFENILDDDEQVIRVIKPHKGKVYLSRIFCTALPCLLYLALILLMVFVPSEEPMSSREKVIVICSMVGLCVVVFALVLIFTALYFKHTYYAVTNKRLIIRTGIIGVDFKSLDYRNLGATDVYVSLLDKILSKNTGTLRFGNASSPMGTNKMYCFSHVRDPYGLYKEIKQYIAKQQDDKK